MQDAPEEIGYLIISRYPTEGLKIETPIGDLYVFIHKTQGRRVYVRVEAPKNKFKITRIKKKDPEYRPDRAELHVDGKKVMDLENVTVARNVIGHMRGQLLKDLPPVVPLPQGTQIEHVWIDEANDIPNLDEIAKKLKGFHRGCSYLAQPGSICLKCGQRVPEDLK